VSNIDRPLMDDYFDGNHAPARADTALNLAIFVKCGYGGRHPARRRKCLYYSRYFPALAGEANRRRGGFFFPRSFRRRIEGTSKDCVIMEPIKPDDEADLKNLDEFKKRACALHLSPDYENHAIPMASRSQGIRGACGKDVRYLWPVRCSRFDQKVCPTSGILATSILWS